MPKKLERCVTQVMATGKTESSAYAICQSSLNKTKKANPKPKK
jgi:hypothetical protein